MDRLLIVCDETPFREGLERSLKETAGWRVESVESSRRAIEKWNAVEIEVLLVDRHLQGGKGGELVREMRALDPHVGIVVITCDPSIEDAAAMLHLEIDGYIEKPVDDMADTVRLLREVIVKVKTRRESAEGEVVPSLTLPSPRAVDPGVQYSIMIVSPLRSEREWMARQFDTPLRVLQASTSAEAIQSIEKTPPDIVIVDATVSDPDVFDFVRSINETVIGTEIMVAAHHLSVKDVKRYIELNVAALIEKPPARDDLRKKLSLLLEKQSGLTIDTAPGRQTCYTV